MANLLTFINEKRQLQQNKGVINSSCTVNERALKASYQVSLRIVKAGKPYITAESLILPAAKDMVNTVISSSDASNWMPFPCQTTVCRRMTSDAKQQLITCIRQSKCFALQLDENTDVLTNCAMLACFVRFEAEGVVKEKFLFCDNLSNYMTADEIFERLDDYIKDNEIDWRKCIDISTDGACSMTGRYTGVHALMRRVAPEAKHCIIHREALACKKMPQDLRLVLDQAVQIVNLIRAQALNSRLFSILSNEMGNDHSTLLLHSEVRWLSRGKVLTHLFELQNEVHIFL